MGEQESRSSCESGGDAMAPAGKEHGRAAADPRLQGISDAIRVVPHFPKPGLRWFFELIMRARVWSVYGDPAFSLV
jgi:adenine phosphoribosyltransferase